MTKKTGGRELFWAKTDVNATGKDEMALGDGLDQPYQNVLRNLKKRRKAEKTYAPPIDDIIEIGSARSKHKKK